MAGGGAFSVCFVRHSVLPSFRPSVASKFVFSTPPTSLHGFEWNLAGMLHLKSRSACGEIIHVRQILAELWSLTLRIFTHFSLSSQLLLHPCMDLNKSWQGCCTTSLEVHVGNNLCSSNIAGVEALEMFALQFCCLYEISSQQGHMFYKHALSSLSCYMDVVKIM